MKWKAEIVLRHNLELIFNVQHLFVMSGVFYNVKISCFKFSSTYRAKVTGVRGDFHNYI